MIRKTVKKRCLSCAHMGDDCENCKHHYTSSYQERVSRPSHDKAGETMSCHSCSYWKPLDGICGNPAGKNFPNCHSMNEPVKPQKMTRAEPNEVPKGNK